MPTFTRIPPSNRTNLTIRLADPEVLGSPTWVFPGETITFTLTVEGGTAPSSPTANIYKDRTETTSTNMPSGSHSASGQVITLKPFTAGVGNSDYSVIVTFTLGSNTMQRKIVVHCIDDKAV